MTQAKITDVGGGSVYYTGELAGDARPKRMGRIDALHVKLPFASARMSPGLLRGKGCAIGRQHMTTLIRRLGVTAPYCKPDTIWPYLLRTPAITRSNHFSRRRQISHA